MNVGIRELKAHLSEYVRRAAGGELVVVTDRGKPVAKLTSIGGVSHVERGIEEGWITPPRRSHPGPAVPMVASRLIQDVLDEDRG